MKPIEEYQTYDLDLAAFLMLQGLKFIEAKTEESFQAGAKPRVQMRFFDEKGTARDLERVFLNSEFKRYNSFRAYLLREVHRTLRGIK